MIKEAVITFFTVETILYFAVGIYLIVIIRSRGLRDGFEKRLSGIYNFSPLIMMVLWVVLCTYVSEAGYVSEKEIDDFFGNTMGQLGLQMIWWPFYMAMTKGVRWVLMWTVRILFMALSEGISGGGSRSGSRSSGSRSSGSRSGGSSRGGGGGRSF